MNDLSENLDTLRKQRNVYIRQHDWPNALIIINKMIEKLPTPSFYTRKGMIEIKLKKYNDGISSLKKALSIEPGYLKARQILMKLSARMGRTIDDDPLDTLMSQSQVMYLYSESVNTETDNLEIIETSFTNADGTSLLIPDSGELNSVFSPPSEVTNMSVLPQQFGHYKDLRLIGSGNMGIVYKAYDPKHDKFVAIKVIHPENKTDQETLKQEANLLSQLHHPNIVNIHEVGVSEGAHYIVMDYVKGETLSTYIKNTKYTYKDALQIIKFVALAMDYAHQNEIIHRDLKPSNIIIEQDTNLPIIMDFGLAANMNTLSQIKRNDISGTPRYMAPEQALGLTYKISPATDVYAIGAILYEMVTQQPVVSSNLPKETLKKIIKEDVIRPTLIFSDLSPEIEAICMKCLVKDLYHRYLNARELVRDIDRHFNGQKVLAPKMNFKNRFTRYIQRHKKKFSVLFLLVVGSLSMLVSTINYQENDREMKKKLELLSRKSYSKEALLAKYPNYKLKIKRKLQLQKQLEISIQSQINTLQLLNKIKLSNKTKQQKINQELLKLSIFDAQKMMILDYLTMQPKELFFSKDYHFLNSLHKKQLEEQKIKLHELMQEVANFPQSYEKCLIKVLRMQSKITKKILMKYVYSENNMQQKLALEYFQLSNTMAKKMRIFLQKLLENTDVEKEQKVQLLIEILTRYRNQTTEER